MSEKTYSGRCLCGAVSFETRSDPLAAGFCNCLSCRKLSGGAKLPNAAFPREGFKLTGETTDYQWTADSGSTITTSFCRVCGSPMYGVSSAMPAMIAVRMGVLDDPEAFAPQMEIYTKRKLCWDATDAAQPAFEGMPPMGG